MEVHAVPVVSQRGHLPLPVLQEGDGPEGHEDAEEDGAWVVEQVAHLPTGRDRTRCFLLVQQFQAEMPVS